MRCPECHERFPGRLFAPVVINCKTVTVCPLCAWAEVCKAHGLPPTELLPQGIRAQAMVKGAADLVTRRGRAGIHPASEVIHAITEATP